jgi:UDP-N-acetylmuramate: L-alanyl-gamma-D-glutamyl-meso-diaminopimelate ligase
LSVEAVVSALTASGIHARVIPHVPEIVETIAREAREGDRVVIMSNGGFDGIHDKLLAALAA